MMNKKTAYFEFCDCMEGEPEKPAEEAKEVQETRELTHEEQVKARIEELETQKSSLIERIKKINRKIKYKQYEKKALGPYLEQTKAVQIAPYRKQKRALEFKISTAAFTPRMERELLKKLRKIDEQLGEVKEVERARRKIKYVEKDISDGETEILTIEEELKIIRGELKKLYDQNKDIRAVARKEAAAQARAEEDMVSLGDIAVIEK
ncbi:MAG: hypothetical protein ABIJ10_05185 [Candidatus Micrarchaeota archaeon]|nr:hypothetical protein [Candidatus Micrarchaeota archaeon]MBU1886474.1 hypothetical protein [Candidatus Micrarchaeota archaeon]